jgi:hypothetical protein
MPVHPTRYAACSHCWVVHRLLYHSSHLHGCCTIRLISMTVSKLGISPLLRSLSRRARARWHVWAYQSKSISYETVFFFHNKSASASALMKNTASQTELSLNVNAITPTTRGSTKFLGWFSGLWLTSRSLHSASPVSINTARTKHALRHAYGWKHVNNMHIYSVLKQWARSEWSASWTETEPAILTRGPNKYDHIFLVC